MFDIPDTKNFMDSVHGYISIPKCFVKYLIDTEIFQRLRNIDQTGMRVVFPTAKHDRFSHSLGVFYLGNKAVDALLEKFKMNPYWRISSEEDSIVFWAKNKVLFLIACLLHDIGHVPFSHALEEFVVSSSISKGVPLSEHLLDCINEKEKKENLVPVKEINAAYHEQIGALCVLEKLADNIGSIYDSLISYQYPDINTDNYLFSEYYQYNPILKKDSLDSDIAFIARMILGLKYTDYRPEYQIKNCFIELLNGKEFDVDKLDYIIRDTKMSGISNIAIDVERLLTSVCIITKTKYKNGSLEEKSDNIITDIDNMLDEDERDSNTEFTIQGNFHGSFNLGMNCNFLIRRDMQKDAPIISLKTLGNQKIKYEDKQPNARFDEKAIVIQNGLQKSITEPDDEENYIELEKIDENGFTCTIENGKLLFNRINLRTGVDSANEDTRRPSCIIEINGYCTLTIKGRFGVTAPIRFFDKDCDIKAENIKEISRLGNCIENQVPQQNAFNEFVIGFNKQAINIIANVLEARDYLYLWIYAHHKVVYYANYLIPALAQQILDPSKVNNESFPFWKLDYDHIALIDDGYVWTAIKYICHTHEQDPNWAVIVQLCKEILIRKYKYSVYKSLAEYDIFFDEFTMEELLSIKERLLGKIDKGKPLAGKGQPSAGFLSQDTVDRLKKESDIPNIKNLLIVDAHYTSKRMSPEKTFIYMKENDYLAISEIPIIAERISKKSQTEYYFYLYYETDKNDKTGINEPLNKEQMDRLKKAIVNLCKEFHKEKAANQG